MFNPQESKLGSQVHPIPNISVKEALETTEEYALTRGGGAPISDKVKKLISLFSDNIGEESFEHFVTYGQEVGCGLLSFASYKNDPRVVLYLCYHEYHDFFGQHVQFYVGACDAPVQYDEIFTDEIFTNGGGETIELKIFFRLHASDKQTPASEAMKSIFATISDKKIVCAV